MSSLSGESTVHGPVVSRSARVADVSYRAFLASRDPPRIHWADPDGLELSGAGAAAAVTASGAERFDAVRKWADRLFAESDHDGPDVARPRLLGGFAFFDHHEAGGAWAGFPAAQFVLPEVQLTSAGDETWLTVTRGNGRGPLERRGRPRRRPGCRRVAPGDEARRPAPRRRPHVADPEKEVWCEQVADALDRIESRATCRRSCSRRHCARTWPAPSNPGTCSNASGSATRSASVSSSNRPTTRRSLAPRPNDSSRCTATSWRRRRSRGRSGAATPLPRMRASPNACARDKLRHEQRLVTDAIADCLDAFGDVTVSDRGVRRLSNIQHLETPIRADVDESTHVLDVVEGLHPTPAVNGLPPPRRSPPSARRRRSTVAGTPPQSAGSTPTATGRSASASGRPSPPTAPSRCSRATASSRTATPRPSGRRYN